MVQLLGLIASPFVIVLTVMFVQKQVRDWAANDVGLRVMGVVASLWMLGVTVLFGYIAGGGFNFP